MKDLFFGYTTKQVVCGVVLSAFLSTTIFWGGLQFYAVKIAESKESKSNYAVEKDRLDRDLYLYTVRDKISNKSIQFIRDEITNQIQIVK